MYIASSLGHFPLGNLLKNLRPFVLMAIMIALAIIVFPPLTVILPRLLVLECDSFRIFFVGLQARSTFEVQKHLQLNLSRGVEKITFC